MNLFSVTIPEVLIKNRSLFGSRLWMLRSARHEAGVSLASGGGHLAVEASGSKCAGLIPCSCSYRVISGIEEPQPRDLTES